jgi:hypothetical protein
MEQGGSVPFPFRQQDLADALGLSIVHTNRRIVALRQAGWPKSAARRLVMHDHRKLSRSGEGSIWTRTMCDQSCEHPSPRKARRCAR